MKNLELKFKELKKMLIEDGYNDSNIVLQTLENIQLEAMNYTRSCKSDSEQLPCDKCDNGIIWDKDRLIGRICSCNNK